MGNVLREHLIAMGTVLTLNPKANFSPWIFVQKYAFTLRFKMLPRPDGFKNKGNGV